MAQYLTQSEYNEMGGDATMVAATYDRREFRAQKAIDEHTFGRVKSESPQRDAVKMLVFELVTLYSTNEALQQQETAGAVSSWSNDGVSVKVEQAASVSPTELAAQAAELIDEFLAEEYESGTGTLLLYRGVSVCP